MSSAVMRFLGIGESLDLGDLYLHLSRRGHEVRVYVSDPECHTVMRGLITRVDDFNDHLEWVRQAGDEGFILFEDAHSGELQDDLRSRGFHVIGGGRYGDRLETDREFGQAAMREVGMQTAPVHAFSSFDDGIAFIRQKPGRYVFKLNGAGYAPSRNHVGELDDGSDLVVRLTLQRNAWSFEEAPSFVLMDYVDGVEVGVGAYFNGEQFLSPACIDFEHKRFFPGDLGELTGEMGTLASYRHSEPLFSRTLKRMEPLLRKNGYLGYINLNTIVNEHGIWPLEFTCRFGYPGFAVLDPLQTDGWDDLLPRMALRKEPRFRTAEGFSVCVVLTVPPFPYRQGYAELSKGAPILFRGALSDEDVRHLHYGEVALKHGQLVADGSIGYLMVATGIGDTVEAARAGAYARARRVVVPNLRYRTDIGERFLAGERNRLERLGLW